MACGPNPRQPRSGCASNFAESRYVRQTGLYDVTVGSTCSGASAVVARMRNGDRARQLVARLNDIFGRPRADLDFITPGIGSDPFASNQYAVIWSQVTWYPDCSQYTDTTDGRTYELVYTGYNDKSKVTTLITIVQADVDLYGKPRWRIALDWANNIRNYVNGWNCTKSPDSPNPPTLQCNGFICPLKVPTGNATSSGTARATHYGGGESFLLPNFAMSNGDIFHTNDLTIAVHSSLSSLDNRWVRISYGGKSVVARVTDRGGSSDKPIDLSRGGVSHYLGFPGSGTVSYGPP
jgi:hypothetical protein